MPRHLTLIDIYMRGGTLIGRFYRYAGRRNVINKTLGNYEVVDYNYIVNTDALRPTIRISHSDNSEFKIPGYNYAILYPEGTGTSWAERPRYYFIDCESVRSTAKGVFEMDLILDSLETYKNEILNSQANVSRSSSNYNLYLNDNFYNAYAYPRQGCLMFPWGFSESYTYLLQVCNTLGTAEEA